MTNDLPVAFHDLPAELFPFTVEYLDADSKQVVESTTVEGPGAIQIPGKEALGVRATIVHFIFPQVEFWMDENENVSVKERNGPEAGREQEVQARQARTEEVPHLGQAPGEQDAKDLG